MNPDTPVRRVTFRNHARNFVNCMVLVRETCVCATRDFEVQTAVKLYRARTIVEDMVYVCSEHVRVVKDMSVVHVRHTYRVRTIAWVEVNV